VLFIFAQNFNAIIDFGKQAKKLSEDIPVILEPARDDRIGPKSKMF